VADARRKLCLWRRDYNHHRPHSALADRTPAEFAAVCSGGKVEAAPRLPLSHRTATTGGTVRNDAHSNLFVEALT
jgi:hypothetical protein